MFMKKTLLFILLLSFFFLQQCGRKAKKDRKIPLKTLPKQEQDISEDSTLNFKR